jgi:hypothetical protein
VSILAGALAWRALDAGLPFLSQMMVIFQGYWLRLPFDALWMPLEKALHSTYSALSPIYLWESLLSFYRHLHQESFDEFWHSWCTLSEEEEMGVS